MNAPLESFPLPGFPCPGPDPQALHQAFYEEHEASDTEIETKIAGEYKPVHADTNRDAPRDRVCFGRSVPRRPSQRPPAPPMCLSVFDEQFALCRSLLEKRARQRLSQEDAEDIVSACYLEARHSLAAYCSERSLGWWLLGVLDNLLRQRSRRRWVRSEELYAADACPEEICDEQTAAGARQEAQRLRLQNRLRAVDLTARQYECVARALNGETQQRIADAMHISQRMVSYHLQAAASRLRIEHSAEQGGAEQSGHNERGAEPAGAHEAELKEAEDWHALDFFCECAHQVIYRKPHSFDNQSTSEERERRRYQCLRDDAKQTKRNDMAQSVRDEKAQSKRE